MRRMLIFSVIFSVSFAVLAFLGTAQAKAAEFSADMVIVPKGDEPMKGKIGPRGANEYRHHRGDEEGWAGGEKRAPCRGR